MIASSSSSRRGNIYQQRHHVLVLFFVLLSMMLSSISGFGIMKKKITLFTKTTTTSSSILNVGSSSSSSSIATEENQEVLLTDEILNGDSSGCMETIREELFEGMSLTVSDEDGISLASPLTYDKFLTMQSKRVPVSVRYSADSGLKPYYLTVAKKIKDVYPDVILDKVVLPKVQMSENSNSDITFEVIVDGKAVVRTSRKGQQNDIDKLHIFVSMQEVEAAILRARKRRRPQTVYGEEESQARIGEVLKNKVTANNKDNE